MSTTTTATNTTTTSGSPLCRWMSIMGRVITITCGLLCLFFFIQCTATGHLPSVMGQPKYEVSPVPAKMSLDKEAEIDAIISKEKMPEPITDKQQPQQQQQPTVKPKLARLISARTRPLTTHRYELSEPVNLGGQDYSDCAYHLAFTLLESSTNEQYPSKLLNKFSNSLNSILANLNATGLDPGSLCVHLITDGHIRPYVRQTVEKVHEELILKSNLYHHNYHSSQKPYQKEEVNFENLGETARPLTRYFFIDSLVVENRLEYLLPSLRSYFTHKPDSYYSNALFFYSMVLHRVFPASVASRLALLDVDVQLDGNLLELYEEFDRFKPDELIGLAYDQQPVYRHILGEYRRTHPDTPMGSAATSSGNGFPGFNSGVVLLYLQKMRESNLYNSLLNSVVIGHMAQKYNFRGHLGDQDFYTLAAFDYRQLFHTLPCTWNRQLCQWWRFHGYNQVFDDYHRCAGPVKLYHGNCNSALPGLAQQR